MSEWKIYSSEGAERATVHTLEYHGEWMGEEYVLVRVKSAFPIDFRFGDWLSYRGESFTINYDPHVVKKARRGTYGEGFTYDNVKASSRLTGISMKDIVLSDNQMAYTSLSKFSFFCASVEDLAFLTAATVLLPHSMFHAKKFLSVVAVEVMTLFLLFMRPVVIKNQKTVP